MVYLYTAEWSRGGVTNEFRLKVPGIDSRMMLLFDALQEKLQKKISIFDVMYKMDVENNVLYILYMHNVDYNLSEPKECKYICESYEILKV